MTNWYQNLKNELKSKFSISNCLIKTSSQEIWEEEFGDFQRWVVDACEVRAFLTKTKYKITISLNIWNGHMGLMAWQDFWKYDVSEMSKAKSSFKKIVQVSKKIINDYKENEIPNNLLWAHLRHECRKIDREHLAKTTIPIINSSLNLDYEPDWRSSIYGTRYPNRDTNAF